MSIRERAPGCRHGSWPLRLLLRGGILLGVAVAVLQVVVLRPLLPNPIATRFAWDGSGVGWIGTSDFLTIHLAVVGAIAGVFIGLPLLLRLHGSRRAADDGRLAHVIDFEQRALLFGLATTTFTLAVVHLVSVANLVRPPRLGGAFVPLLATYLVFTAAWTVLMVRRFGRRATAAAPAPASA